MKHRATSEDLEGRALEYLRKHGPVSCASLGDVLWGKPGRGNCSCPWARPAGALLHRMLKRNLVTRRVATYGTEWRARQ
jgi:hypothetical protein